MIKLATLSDQSSPSSIDHAIAQAEAANYKIPLNIFSDQVDLSNLLATRDVAGQGRSVHRYGLGGDCAMPKLPSL
jgi:hypothetical protein